MKLLSFTGVLGDMEQQEPTDPKLDQAWELLKSAKTVEPSAFFSRNVIREVRRLEEETQAGWMARLKDFFSAPTLRPVAIATAACVAVAITALVISNPDGTASSDPAVAAAPVETEVFAPAVEMAEVQYFGELMAVADPAMLDDASLAELFF